MSRSERAVFRLPGVALVIPFLLFICVTPLANAGADFWLALYVFPAVGLAYILLTRTIADAETIRTTGLLGNRRIAWGDLDGLEFHGPRWAIAVGTSGRRFRLPMIRPRDLPRLAQVSGGRLLLGRDAPAQPVDDPSVEPDTDLQDSNAQDTDVHHTDVQDTEIQDTDVQDTELLAADQTAELQLDAGQDTGRPDTEHPAPLVETADARAAGE